MRQLRENVFGIMETLVLSSSSNQDEKWQDTNR
jgi:hypothetical protein